MHAWWGAYLHRTRRCHCQRWQRAGGLAVQLRHLKHAVAATWCGSARCPASVKAVQVRAGGCRCTAALLAGGWRAAGGQERRSTARQAAGIAGGSSMPGLSTQQPRPRTCAPPAPPSPWLPRCPRPRWGAGAGHRACGTPPGCPRRPPACGMGVEQGASAGASRRQVWQGVDWAWRNKCGGALSHHVHACRQWERESSRHRQHQAPAGPNRQPTRSASLAWQRPACRHRRRPAHLDGRPRRQAGSSPQSARPARRPQSHPPQAGARPPAPHHPTP